MCLWYHKYVIPQHLCVFFWDIDTDAFDPASYPEYTIARVLEYGDDKAVRWLRETFSENQIKQVVRIERRLSRRSANFWALVYSIPKHEVAALQSTT